TNIGNPDEYTVRELAEIVLEATGSDSSIEYLPLPTDDPKVRRPDITKARQRLGWEPRVAVRDGVARTTAYLRTVLEAEAAAPSA
ncbi:MAG TPA: hypothetical protein VF048_12370, partial [Gemmatimonadaceae bacterium]